MALVVGDNLIVTKTLETTGISVLLKMYKSLPEAESVLLAGWVDSVTVGD
jgi:hypothetical protein